MFNQKFRLVCKEFQDLMGTSVPEWFINYLIETRSDIVPESKRFSVKVTAWQEHSFEEIEAYLHALHMSPAGMLFNSILSKKTGFIMAHQCGCDDCFYPGTIDIVLSDIPAIQQDFLNHVDQQKRQLNIAA
jgi:hypothetical protein